MLQWPGVRILRRNELDAFLAQALSPKLYEPDQLQDLKVIYVENEAWGVSREYPQTHIKGPFTSRHMWLNIMNKNTRKKFCAKLFEQNLPEFVIL